MSTGRKGGNQAATEADRILSGQTRSDRPFAGTDLEPLEKLPSVPAYLGKIAKKEWRKIGRQMIAEKTLMKCQIGALEAYCTAYAMFVVASRDIEDATPTIVNKVGNVVTNPAHTNYHKALGSLKACQNELGLTPNSKRPPTRVGKSKGDPLAGGTSGPKLVPV
jgi:P27 family predicted phage terminase small subunit